MLTLERVVKQGSPLIISQPIPKPCSGPEYRHGLIANSTKAARVELAKYIAKKNAAVVNAAIAEGYVIKEIDLISMEIVLGKENIEIIIR